MGKSFLKLFFYCAIVFVTFFAFSPSFAASAGRAPARAAQPAGPSATMLNSIDAALAYNPELKAYQEGRQLSQHAVERAKGGHLPRVDLSAGGGFSMLSDATTRQYNDHDKFQPTADASLLLTLPLFHGFSVTQGVDRAKSDLDSSDNLVQERGTSIVFAALSAHIDVLRRRQLVDLAQNNVREHEKILRSVQERYNTGVATAGELNQVESRHARARATLASYSSALDAAKANYLRVTGKNPGPLAPGLAPKGLFKSADEVREVTLNNNPSLKSSMAVVKSAVHEKGQAKSRYYPQLDLLAGPSWADRRATYDAHATDVSAELRMGWNLYSGGEDTATVRMTSAKIRQARQNLHALMNALNEDIESTFSRFLSSAIEARDYKLAKEASRKARDDYYKQFLNAQRSLIDVLDAESDCFYAACQEVMSLSDRLISSYRLLAVSGSLLSELHLDPAALRVDSPTTNDNWVNDLKEFDSPLKPGGRMR